MRQHHDDRPPVGRRRIRVTLGGLGDLDRSPRTIVGVVGDVKEQTIYQPTPPTVYIPVQ